MQEQITHSSVMSRVSFFESESCHDLPTEGNDVRAIMKSEFI